jgi:hypothetical protein
MTGFSVEAALSAPFKVIRRKPLALLAWAVVYLVIGFAPSMVVYAKFYPVLLAQSTGAQAYDPAALEAAMGPVAVWWPALWLLGIVTLSVLYGAVFRAVLTPEDDKFLYLRLGVREMWLGLTTIALVIVFAIGFMVLAGSIALVAKNAPWYATFAAVIAAIVGVIWLLTRFSLSMVVAFAEKRFVFVDSWPLTRGRSLTLFGVALAITVMLIISEMLLLVPFSVAFGLTGAYQRIGTDPAFVVHNLPWVAVGCIVFALFGALTYTLMGAPWASIYQQLTEKPKRPSVSVGEAVPLDRRD